MRTDVASFHLCAFFYSPATIGDFILAHHGHRWQTFQRATVPFKTNSGVWQLPDGDQHSQASQLFNVIKVPRTHFEVEDTKTSAGTQFRKRLRDIRNITLIEMAEKYMYPVPCIQAKQSEEFYVHSTGMTCKLQLQVMKRINWITGKHSG